MKVKDIKKLAEDNTWIRLKDGRRGVFRRLDYNDVHKQYFTVVNLPNEDDPYAHDEIIYPAQIDYAEGNY